MDALIVLDRQADLVTPFLTQLTYEGLVDELIGIKNGDRYFVWLLHVHSCTYTLYSSRRTSCIVTCPSHQPEPRSILFSDSTACIAQRYEREEEETPSDSRQ